MRSRVVTVLVAALLAGCGVPSEPKEQAEELASIAAEGAILAHDAAEGSTISTFTREHAKALRKNLRELVPKLEHEELARIADAVDAALSDLADAPGDEAAAARTEKRLDAAAAKSEELAR